MAVRPIDANAMLSELRPVSFEAEHSAVLLSNVSKMMREWVERQPTLTPPTEWVSVKDRLPQLPTNSDWCSIMVITTRKNDTKSRLMIYERAIVRGKRVERWKYYWDKIADELPDYWMPLPEPPDSRPSED